jgi:hypothetical protein
VSPRAIFVPALVIGAIGLGGCGGAASGSASGCDPSYKGACLDPNASDYDCASGKGNGPKYTGMVTVVGNDHFGLDRDGDGVGCES